MTLQEVFEREIDLANAENRTIIIFEHEGVFYISLWVKNKWDDLIKYDRPVNIYKSCK